MTNINRSIEREIRIKQDYTHSYGAERIIEHMNKSLSPKISSTLVYQYQSGIRRIVDLSNDMSIVERKVTIFDKSQPIYKYVESSEEKVSSTSAESMYKYNHMTYRVRYMYDWVYKNIPLDLHVTFRTMIEDKKVTISTSIEIELSNPKISIDKEDLSISIVKSKSISILEIVTHIMGIHNGWTISNIPDVFSGAKGILRTMGITSYYQLQRPYDLTWKDLIYDNMIQNPVAISIKADGTRMLLLMYQSGIFFITSSLDLIPLNTSKSSDIKDIKNITKPILIDGELMNIKGQYIYYAFDLLYADKSYVNEPYTTRHKLIHEFLPSTINTNISDMKLVTLKIKPIITPTTVPEFFKAVDLSLNDPLPKDGIIITHINKPYSNPVYKYKEPHMMTVDFFIGPDKTLGTFDDGIKYHKELVPLDIDKYAPIGIVAEFEYINPTTWKFKRMRIDKSIPNSERVYQSIIKLHRDPIRKVDITGKSMSLMRKYHNRVKDTIYDFLAKEGIDTILDLGSGKGGDLPKWIRNNMSVDAIEPDITNIKDLISRASTFASMDSEIYIDEFTYDKYEPTGLVVQETSTKIIGSCWDVTIYPEKAENFYPRREVGAITSFNSATFFGPQTISCLLDCVSPDNSLGYVVFMVMDGKVLKKEFLSNSNSYESPLISIKSVACPPEISNKAKTSAMTTTGEAIQVGSDRFGNLGCIDISLESSTVERTQTEALVDVDTIIETMEKNQWIAILDEYLTEEKLLGQDATKYTSAQRVVIFKKGQSREYVRNIYKSLKIGDIENISTPWGNLVRVGVPSIVNALEGNMSFYHAILQASSEKYRSSSMVGKAVFASAIKNKNAKLDITVPIYIIPSNSWDIVMGNNKEITIYPALNPSIPREKGIVILDNNSFWEPLGRKNLDGSINYIW